MEAENITGELNEDLFVQELRYKKFKNIRYSLQLFLKDLYGDIDEYDLVMCWKNDMKQKYDILIKIGDITKRISIKKGSKNSVHSEPISEFTHFLIENGLPKEQVIEFLKYHYADGTTNGTGETRISCEEYKKSHKDEMDKINYFFNTDDLLKKAVDRFIVYGRNPKYPIDAILYGIPNDFIWIKRESIYKVVLDKKNSNVDSIHFGPLVYQTMDKNLNYNEKYESKRFICQIKWFSLFDDIIEITDKSMYDLISA